MSTLSDTKATPFALALRIVAGFAVVTGLIDVFAGTGILPLMGSQLPANAAADPALDSQFRFLSATWFAYGLALWWVTQDLPHRIPMLNILAIAMFVGGLGRLISIVVNGMPPAPLLAFLAIELLGPITAVVIARRLNAVGVRPSHPGE